MTSGNSWQRQDTHEACETLAQLLHPFNHTPEDQLLRTSGLTDRLFERAIMDLLLEGRARRHAQQDGQWTYLLTTSKEEVPGNDPHLLCDDARAIHQYLQAQPNTARMIALSLRLPDLDVHRLLTQLERLGLVDFRYVGRLNIYRAC